MSRPLPWRLARAATRAAVGLLFVLTVVAPVSAQDLASVDEATDMSRLPDSGDVWSRIGDGFAVILEGEALLLNDNGGSVIAYEAMVGRLTDVHRITFASTVKAVSNLGGDAVLIEVSRPGLEYVVQLSPDRIDAFERVDVRDVRWIAGVAVDLTDYRDVTVTKESSTLDPLETLTVTVDGVEMIRAAGNEGGRLGVGRVVFGSLGYADMGASYWSQLRLVAEPFVTDEGVPVESTSLGDLKARYR